MNCLDYVLSKIPKKTGDQLKEILSNRSPFLNKSKLREEDVVVFTEGYHVGFGTLKEYYNIETDEYSNGKNMSRLISLYDERVKIVMINPTLKKGRKNDQLERIIREDI